MTGIQRGLLLGAIHVALVAALAGKLLLDRAALPRVWARVGPVDPSLPIRGRYVQLALEAVVAPDLRAADTAQADTMRTDTTGADTAGADTAGVRPSLSPLLPARLVVEGESLVARAPSDKDDGVLVRIDRRRPETATLARTLAFFIPEHVDDPSRRPPGEELWAEVTVPRRGLPRPIRLGVRRGGQLTPLDLR